MLPQHLGNATILSIDLSSQLAGSALKEEEEYVHSRFRSY